MRDIFVYALNISALDETDERWKGFISPERARRVAEYRSAADRRRSLGVELALNAALSAHVPDYCPPPEYRYLDGGRPALLSGAPHISLAHAGDWAVCALSDAPVGVDIEAANRKSSIPIWQWVGMESYLKLTGEGLSGKFRSLCATRDEISLDGLPLAHLSRAKLDEGTLLCAASEEPCGVRVRTIEVEEFPWEHLKRACS